ncbi:hypothetical protein D3C76_1592630 [compost metagenome]
MLYLVTAKKVSYTACIACASKNFSAASKKPGVPLRVLPGFWHIGRSGILLLRLDRGEHRNDVLAFRLELADQGIHGHVALGQGFGQRFDAPIKGQLLITQILLQPV